MKLNTILIFLLLTVNVFSQNCDKDSIITAVQDIESDLLKCSYNKVKLNPKAVDSITNIIYNTNPTESNNVICYACAAHCIGVYWFRKRNMAKAIDYYKKAIQLREQFDDGLLWKSYLNLGIAYYEMNLTNESIRSLRVSDSLNPNMPLKYQLNLRRYLGLNLEKLGDFKNAKLEFEEALSYRKLITNTSDLYRIGIVCFDYTNLLVHTENSDYMEEVRYWANKCINYFDTTSIKKHKEYISKFNNSKAIAYRYSKNYYKSLNKYQEAYSLSEDEKFKLKVKTNIGALLTEKKEYINAVDTLKSALIAKKSAYQQDSTNFNYIVNYLNIGECYEGLDDYENALTNYHYAIINSSRSFKDNDVFKNPSINKDFIAYKNIDFMEYLDAKGRVALQLYHDKKERKYLDLASETYNRAYKFHSFLYEDITDRNSRLILAKVILPYIENALKVQYEYKEIGEEDEETVFKFMELNKASVLMQRIIESNAIEKAGIPTDSIRKEKSLKVKILSLKKEAENNESKSVLIKKYEEDLKKFIRNLESTYPIYKKLKYQPSKFDLNQLQNKIDNSKAVLEYFIGDTSIYVLAIQKEQTDFFQIKKPGDWETLIDSLHSAITKEKNLIIFSNTAHELYNLIVEKPIECLDTSKIKHLQIIPDAELNRIPFAALLTELKPSNNDDFSKLDYLANQFNISYGFSSKLVFDVNNKVRKRTAPSFAAFLAKDLENINQYCDQLVDIIRGKFGGEIYMNENCTTENFKTHTKDYNVLDLVMHCSGAAGALAFNDKELFDIDIYDLDLSNTQLIYLTACETNVGILQKGEGIMSLSRAFTYSGCPTLVSTLWSVRTESTCLISKLFFDEVKNGKPVDVALSEAQRKYIKEVDTIEKIDADISAHPYYWAGIIPIGKMESITFKK